MKYYIDRHDNYSLASIASHHLPVVSVYITVDIHQEHTAETEALQLMYADLLLSGAGTYTRETFLNAINTLGANVSVGITEGLLTIKLASTKESFPKLLSLVETMLTEPRFLTSELKRIKEITKNELHEAKENSKVRAQAGLRNALYGNKDRKYTTALDKLPKNLNKITPQHHKQLHRQVLELPWICTIAGHKDAVVAFESLVMKIKEGNGFTVLNATHQPKAPKRSAVLVDIPSRQNIDFSIGASVPFTIHHDDYLPLLFGLTVLGKWGGFTGRLMSTVREQEGLTYGIYARPSGFSSTEQGYWYIMTFFAPDKALQGITSTYREVTKLYDRGVSEKELEKFKIILNTQETLLGDSVISQLSDLHIYNCHNFTAKQIEVHKARINTLTKNEVNAAIKKYLNPANLTISGAGPISGVKKDIKEFINNVT